MTGKILNLRPCADIPAGLDNIATDIEKGVFGEVTTCTILFNGEVFHLGEFDENQSILEAMLDIQRGNKKILEMFE